MPNGCELRVMSFNVLNGSMDRHAGRWERRRHSVAGAIRAFEPDLLGAQEVQGFQAEFLCDEFPGYACCFFERAVGRRAGEHVASFYRRDRFEKVSEGRFWLSATPDIAGSKGRLAFTARVTHWVRLRCRDSSNAELVFFNTHFDPLYGLTRVRSARLLRERIMQIAGDLPAVVTGDFNAPAGRMTYTTLLQGRPGDPLKLVDAYRSIHPPGGKEGTWHGRGIRLPRRIDWILHTPHFGTLDAQIDCRRHEGCYPSDHFPVTAVLELNHHDAAGQAG